MYRSVRKHRRYLTERCIRGDLSGLWLGIYLHGLLDYRIRWPARRAGSSFHGATLDD